MNMPELALIALFVSSIAVAVSWRIGVQAKRALAQRDAQIAALEQQLTLHGQSIRALTSGAVGIDRRLRRTEAIDKLLSDRQETFENQQAAEQPYSQAIRLVQQGATRGRLVEELSLSESEADLIVRLHGLRDSA